MKKTPATRALARLGKTIDRYALINVIGEGGFGAVYKAQRMDDSGQPMGFAAVKILETTEQEAAERFLKEAQIISHLSSPYTVRLYDTGVTDEGELYLAMEYLEGESLTARLKRMGRLPWTTALEIVEQVCRSLHEAHTKGIIHRDIKGENIFLHRVPGDEVARVLDFGIARLERANTQLTSKNMLIGTPNCMSPEQIRSKPIDGRSDLYSLGVVMFRTLTGRLPFYADSPHALLYLHVHEPPPTPADMGITLPEGVCQLLTQLLAKHPDQRPADAAALRRQIKGLLRNDGRPLTDEDMGRIHAGQSIVATPSPGIRALGAIPGPPSPPPPGHDVTALSPMAFPADEALTEATDSGAIPSPPDQPGTPVTLSDMSVELEPSKPRWPLFALGGVLVAAAIAIVAFSGEGPPGSAQADAALPLLSANTSKTPTIAESDAVTPEAAISDAAVPDIGGPDMAVPDAAIPDAAAPNAAPVKARVSPKRRRAGRRRKTPKPSSEAPKTPQRDLPQRDLPQGIGIGEID